MATRDAYGDELVELGKKYQEIVVFDADLTKSTKTNVFKKAFPERHFNMGIAEANMIVNAAGMATCGKIPFASSFAIFASGRTWEQIRMSVCYSNLNVKIVATHGGITVGEDGASHQANEDIAIMRALPNMTVIVPADGIETKKALRAVVEYKGPIYMRLGRSPIPVIFDEDYKFEIGKASVLKQGKDVTIISCGIMTGAALEACVSLEAEGFTADVLNMATIKPLDTQAILDSIKKTGCVVTAEEHSIVGGLGSAVAEFLSKTHPTPLEMVGMNDCFGESGKPAELLEKYHMTPADIIAAAKKVVGRK